MTGDKSLAMSDSWPGRIQRLHDDSGGFLNIMVVQSNDIGAVVGMAQSGDALAERIARAVAEMMTVVGQGSRRTPVLCTSCWKPLRRSRFAVVIASPDHCGPSAVITMAICNRPLCGPTGEAIQRQAAAALRRIWPDARSVALQDRGIA